MKMLSWPGTRRAHAATLGLLFAAGGESRGQWDFVNLHPEGPETSLVFAVGDGQQAGYTAVGTVAHAALWAGSASSWVDLNPAGADASMVMAVAEGQQVGWATFKGVPHAGYWTGTAASWVDLNAGWSRGYARVAGGQAGQHGTSPNEHAAIWTSGALIDLNPAGSSRSTILGAGDGQQVGYAEFASRVQAAIWTGSAGSYLNLGRPLFQVSEAWATDGYQQGGMAWFNNVDHASLWYGSAESWVDLAPGGRHSKVFGLEDGEQVGFVAVVMYVPHAALWRGIAESWVDLHTFAPPGPGSLQSYARGIRHGPHSTVIGGVWANQAALWIRHDCIADCDRDGLPTLADFGCFQTRFALGSARADCDENGILNLADFGCFQTHFAQGCP